MQDLLLLFKTEQQYFRRIFLSFPITLCKDLICTFLLLSSACNRGPWENTMCLINKNVHFFGEMCTRGAQYIHKYISLQSKRINLKIFLRSLHCTVQCAMLEWKSVIGHAISNTDSMLHLNSQAQQTKYCVNFMLSYKISYRILDRR